MAIKILFISLISQTILNFCLWIGFNLALVLSNFKNGMILIRNHFEIIMTGRQWQNSYIVLSLDVFLNGLLNTPLCSYGHIMLNLNKQAHASCNIILKQYNVYPSHYRNEITNKSLLFKGFPLHKCVMFFFKRIYATVPLLFEFYCQHKILHLFTSFFKALFLCCGLCNKCKSDDMQNL